MKRREGGEGPPLPALQPVDLEDLRRLTRTLTLAGLAAKASLFFLFFLWAAKSPTGDAALRGVVLADLFTWLAFSAVDFHFRRFQVTAGALFELALLLLFANRESLLSIEAAPVATAVTMIFFFGFAVLKAAVWGAEHALQISGVKESA